MKMSLHDYDVFPMVFLTDTPQTVTVRARNARCFPQELQDITVTVREMAVAEDSRFPGTSGDITLIAPVKPEGDGEIRFVLNLPREGEYGVYLSDKDKPAFALLNIYALAHDMAGKVPLRGDLHMHTNGSDGHEDATVVAANYRSHGYDFTVISDHHNYTPSLVARKTFEIDESDHSPLVDMLIVPGEEVHLPLAQTHYVNFGGKYSINALLYPANGAPKAKVDRSLTGECPDAMTVEAFREMIRQRAESVPRKIQSEREDYAVFCWIHEQIVKNGGLGIYPHPYWRCSTMQLSEDYTRFLYEEGRDSFDAFEVLGGENYYQHNGYQTAFYYEEKAKGFDPPVVGSTDSHGSTENNRNALICSTIVFATENTTAALIDAIKAKYSVAVDTISAEYRLVGDFRWIKYGSFLIENWYPLHDLACAAEGFYMNEYLKATPGAAQVLHAMKGQLPGMLKKYFAV